MRKLMLIEVFCERVTAVVIVFALAMFPLASAFAQTRDASAGSTASSGSSLEGVLTQMDLAAATFRSAEADFVWDQFQKVVNETDTQKGKVYYRRTGKGDTQMSANIQSPDQKFLVVADGKVRIYQPKIQPVNEYDTGKNRDQFQSFLVLGFGGRGHDLPKQFDVTFGGYENVDSVKTAKLELVPKAPN